MRHRERQGAAGQRQAVGQQPAAELGQEPVRAGRGAGLVHQPSEGPRQIHWQIHAAIMPPRPLACHPRRGDAQPASPVHSVPGPLSRRKPGPIYPLLVPPRGGPRLFVGEAFKIVCRREPPCFLLGAQVR